jgi:coenzyme F420-reducing hydrogenase gamma subunit
MSRPTTGIFGLTGCAGDQLVILNCEEQLPDLLSLLDVRDFLMGASANDTLCDLDLAFVDGAVLSQRDEETLLRIRQRAKRLVAIGTCAVWGGVAAMNGDAERTELLEQVYGPLGRTYDSTHARALHEVVEVDLSIAGCPIEKEEFLSAVASLLHGDAPLLPQQAVCAECKMRENNCLLVQNGAVCCGPLTIAGCNARCPALRIPCVGCRGPANDANVASAFAIFEQKGISREEIVRKLRTFAPVGARP